MPPTDQPPADDRLSAVRERRSATGTPTRFIERLATPEGIAEARPQRRSRISWLPPCECGGDASGLRDWARRLFAASPYNFKVEAYPVPDEGDYFYVTRFRRDGSQPGGWYLCDCGRWVRRPLVMPHRAYVRDFKSERAADEYVRRLRHGVPQRYELLMILAAGIGGALPYIIVEIIRAL